MKYESPYFEFIENNHPQYYSDDRVLLCDILFRYITDDGDSEDDLEWIEETIKTKSEALQELKRLEALLFSEALWPTSNKQVTAGLTISYSALTHHTLLCRYI